MGSDTPNSKLSDPIFLGGAGLVALSLLCLVGWFDLPWTRGMFQHDRFPMTPFTAFGFITAGVWLFFVPGKPLRETWSRAGWGTFAFLGLLVVGSAWLLTLPWASRIDGRMSATTMGLFLLVLGSWGFRGVPLVPTVLSATGFVVSLALACGAPDGLVTVAGTPYRMPSLATDLAFLGLFPAILLDSAPRVRSLGPLFGPSRWAGTLRCVISGLYFVGTAALVRELFLFDFGRGTPFVTFFPAIMLATIVTETLAGAVAIGASVVITIVFILQGAPTFREAFAMGIFVVSGGFTLILSDGWRRAARTSVENRRHELEQMARLRALLATIPDLVWLKDVHGVYLASNRRHADFFGLPEDQVVGKTDADLVSPGLARSFLESDRDILTTGEPTKTERELTFASDGHRETLEILKAPVRDEEGTILGILGVGRDISQHRAMIEELAIREERLRLAIEGTQAAIWDWDLATGKVYRSPNWWTMLGYSSPLGDATVTDTRSLIHPEDLDAVMSASRNAIETQGGYTVRSRMLCADGSWRWVESRGRVSAVDTQGKSVRISGINTDVQAQIDAQRERDEIQAEVQQSQKMEGLGHLASGIAHDMNNVLGVILGQASAVLADQRPDSPEARAFQAIIKASKRGGNLIKGLLTFARKGPVEPEVFSFNDLIRQEISFLEPTTLARARFVQDLAGDLLAVRGDRDAFQNLVLNLCVNSLDAMDQPGVITIRTRNGPDQSITVEVSDTGRGMPPEVLARAIDPFFTTKPRGKGTGLGLATAYTTVHNHGGHLSLSSTVGSGTSVTFTLPAVDHAVPNTPDSPPPFLSPPQASLRVLLIDDDPLIREVAGELLQVLGHRVAPAASGEEGLDRLAREDFDLVILDMTMPGLGGPGTLPLVRLAFPELPIILATGLADEAALALVRDYPRVTLLTKPFDVEDLARTLSEASGS
jgi:PAS domain S-box-containing protein